MVMAPAFVVYNNCICARAAAHPANSAKPDRKDNVLFMGRIMFILLFRLGTTGSAFLRLRRHLHGFAGARALVVAQAHPRPAILTGGPSAVKLKWGLRVNPGKACPRPDP